MMTRNNLESKLKATFIQMFGAGEGIHLFFAPGRVNLIGEHTDYNGGNVFPCALNIGTYIAIRIRTDGVMRFFSLNYPEQGVITSDINRCDYDIKDGWTNYPKGIVYTLKEKNYEVTTGFDMAVYGNIPNGSGLSSSASLEVVTAFSLAKLHHLELPLVELALLCQYSENHYNHVHCGIMDQFAIAMGQKDHAMLLDTNTMKYRYVPIKLDGIVLVIASSNKKRGLADSKYNERRSECEQALKCLQDMSGKKIEALCELTPAEFEQVKVKLHDPIIMKRAKHAIYENERTKKAVTYLENGDIEAFGKLMNQSHQSLKEDYEVTGIELDTLVDHALKQPGVYGSRMTGAGFGGCTISLVKEEHVEAFIQNVGKSYKETIGYPADFYCVRVGDGPQELLC
jgi:galactokinase